MVTFGARPASRIRNSTAQSPSQPGARHPMLVLQRAVGNRAARALSAPAMSGGGAALPPATRRNMERSFGADFSSVRVHVDSADATQIGARAYTAGNDIHFAAGHWSPSSASGRALIGHELAHVMQQRDGLVRPTGLIGGAALNEDTRLERQADTRGAAAARGESVASTPSFGARASATAVQRSPVIQGSFVIRNEYRVLEPPLKTVVNTLMRWSGQPQNQVEQDVGLNAAGFRSNDQFNSVEIDRLERPDRVVAYINGVNEGVRNKGLQEGIGKMGNLEDILRGRQNNNSYQGGHLLKNQVGGFWPYTNTGRNLAPQASASNTAGGTWKNAEDELQELVNDGKSVFMEAVATYPESTYLVPPSRIIALLDNPSTTLGAINLRNRLVAPDAAAATTGHAQSAWNSFKGLGSSLWDVAAGTVTADVGRAAGGIGNTLWNAAATPWHLGRAAVSSAPALAIGLKQNLAGVTFNTWTPSQVELKYTAVRGIKRSPSAARKYPVFEGGNIGGLFELIPGLARVFGTFSSTLIRLLLPISGWKGYSAFSPLGGNIVENQQHHAHDIGNELASDAITVSSLYGVLRLAASFGYNGAKFAELVLSLMPEWGLAALAKIGVTTSLVSSYPIIASALFVWLLWNQFPSVTRLITQLPKNLLVQLWDILPQGARDAVPAGVQEATRNAIL